MAISKTDVLYVMIVLRKKAIQNGLNLERFTITIKDIANYLNTEYTNVYKQIKILEKEEYIFEKNEGYLAFIGKNYVENIEFIYNECEKVKLNPNDLLNPKCVEIIKKGLGRKNIIVKDLYSDINSRTLKKYLSMFIKTNFVFLGVGEKPLKIDMPDNYLFRVVLLLNGLIPDYKKTKEEQKEENELKLEAIKKELTLLEKNKKEKIAKFEEIFQEQKIHFITHTTALEGNTMSYEEVKALLIEGKILQTHQLYEIDENRNMEKALKFIENKVQTPEIINEEDIKTTNKILLTDIKKPEYEKVGGSEKVAGIYRHYKVHITNNPNFKVTEPKNIQEEIDKYVEQFQRDLVRLMTDDRKTKEVIEEKIKFATWVHSEFQHIHPFGDGNSRTTRLLFNYVMMKFNFPLIDIYNLLEYLNHTKKENKRNDDELYSYFLRLILDNLQKMNLGLKN